LLMAWVIGWEALPRTEQYVVLLQASPESRGQLLRSPVIAQSNNGTISFDFLSRISDVPGVLFVDVRAEWSPDYTAQDRVYRAEGDVVRGVIHLGSIKDPVGYASRYYFQVRDAAGKVYIDGSIVVQGYRLATPLTTAATSIGLLASILQLLLVIGECFPEIFRRIFSAKPCDDATIRDQLAPVPPTLSKRSSRPPPARRRRLEKVKELDR
jgi:hypothetical protein